jgi:ribosomal protein L37AE/L43A
MGLKYKKLLKQMAERKNPEGHHPCPECGSRETLVGGNDCPNYCTDCNHEWAKPAHHEPTSEHRVLKLKAPSILLTFNKNLRPNKSDVVFEKKICEAINKIK